MHIAIEGSDGAGKTTLAKTFAERFDFVFLQNPIYDLIGNEGYNISLEKLSSLTSNELNQNISALLYGAGCLYLKHFRDLHKNIITDRYLCSTYYCDYNNYNRGLFDFLAGACPVPELTILLYAKPEVRYQRILKRNPKDFDLKKNFSDRDYETAKEFLKKYNMKYILIDNSNLSVDETVEKINNFTRI